MTYRSLTATGEAATAFLEERPIPDRLASLGLPTLVLFGSEDKRWQPSSPMFEDPDTTGALLHDFVSDG